MKSLAIIPARGGSKRIPKKNIKEFLGKPIIAYSIEAAIKSNKFEEIMVSTDDEEIAEVAQKYGAKIPFLRSTANSNDFATVADVILEVLGEYRKANREFENICCLFATAPSISSNKLIEAYDLLVSGDYTSIFTIQSFDYPIWRSLLQDEKNYLQLNWPEHLNTRSQDLPKAYHDAGQFYWASTEAFINEKTFFTKKAGGILLGGLEAIDIDTTEDWVVAEKLHQL